MFDLTGKTALVTGATGGIGEAIARALHGRGATVAISGTREEKLAALASEFATRVHVLPCNLADKEAVEALVPNAELRPPNGELRQPAGTPAGKRSPVVRPDFLREPKLAEDALEHGHRPSGLG